MSPQIHGSSLDPEGVITKPRRDKDDVHPDSPPAHNKERAEDKNVESENPASGSPGPVRFPGKGEKLPYTSGEPEAGR